MDVTPIRILIAEPVPLIGELLADRLTAEGFEIVAVAPDGSSAHDLVLQHQPDLVILDIPLLTENPREGLQGRIVVDVPVETQVRRLVEFRGFDEADARARIGRQAKREARLAGADFVIDNSGSPEHLGPQIDELWRWLSSLPQLPADYEPTTPKPK
ncbi:MAG: dephospho-CoA kinase [Actinomycetota bacterium]